MYIQCALIAIARQVFDRHSAVAPERWGHIVSCRSRTAAALVTSWNRCECPNLHEAPHDSHQLP